MSGLDAVIARVDDIESRIVSLDAAARASQVAEAAAAPVASAATEASAATFAGVLDAVKAATGADAGAIAGSVSAGSAAAGGTATGAELVSMLQTLFSAQTGESTTPSDPVAAMQKLAGMLG